MLKKIMIPFFLVCIIASVAHARGGGQRQESSDFTSISSASDTLVSNTAWTAVPATDTVDASRWALLVSQYSGNSSSFILQITSNPLAPGTTNQGFTYRTTDPPWILSISGRMYLWAITLGASAQNLYCTELK